jgi:hypothetical protein
MSLAVERRSPAPASRAACSARGRRPCRACRGQADPLPDQFLVRLAGRSCQRLTQQPDAEVGVPDPLARPASQPGPGQALVDLLERQPRIGVAALPQPPAEQSLEKGSRVVVMGRLQQRSWTAEDAARSVVEVVVEELGPSLRWATATMTRTRTTRS